MKKLLASIVFLGFIVVAFCTSGWMANAMTSMHAHGTEHVSECCIYETVTHHTEEITAVNPTLKIFNFPAILLVTALLLTVLTYRLPILDGHELAHFFHRFSRGIFQLE